MAGHGDPISLLPAAGPLTGAELLVTVQDGETRQFATVRLMSPTPPAGTVSGARAFNSAPLDVSLTTEQPVAFDQVDYDTDGYYLGFDGVMTVPAPGVYNFAAFFVLSGGDAGTNVAVQLRDAGGVVLATVVLQGAGVTNSPWGSLAGQMLLSAGGTVTMFVTCNGSDAQLDGAFACSPAGPLPTSPPLPPYLYDTFTDSDGHDLVDHTMNVGPGWSAPNGFWHIESNLATDSPAADNDVVVSDAGHSDYRLSANMVPTDDGSLTGLPSLLFRYVDLTNYGLVQLDSLNGLFTIFERIGGVYHLRATASVSLPSGTSHSVVLTVVGADISASVDGAHLISFSGLTVGPGSFLCGLRLGLGSLVGAPATLPTWDTFLCVPPP